MLYSTTFNYASQEIEVGQDTDGRYWISENTIDELLEIRTRDLLNSKRLKVIQGDDYKPAKCFTNTGK